MGELKHIVLFSGGAASSCIACLVAQEHKDTILLHTPTYSEHPDADRFRKQVANYIGLPITIQADGRDIWQLIDDENCLPSNWIPFCTRILKQEQTKKFIQNLNDDFILYYGYGVDEWRRVQKQSVRFEQIGWKAQYPLFERKISDLQVKDTIKNVWRICLPEPYKYLEHNNCIPCWKGGKGHFQRVAKYYPEYFLKAIEKEKQIGHTVFKDCTLQDIWDEVQAKKNQVDWFEELEDTVPCMCAI